MFSFRPAFAASYEEINDFLGKGHYKKLYQARILKILIQIIFKILIQALNDQVLPLIHIFIRFLCICFYIEMPNKGKDKTILSATDALQQNSFLIYWQNADFKKFVRSDVKIPLRLIQPDAPEKSLMCKGKKEKEKTVTKKTIHWKEIKFKKVIL